MKSKRREDKVSNAKVAEVKSETTQNVEPEFEPITQKSQLSGGRLIAGYGPMPASVEIPRPFMQAAGLLPYDQVMLTCTQKGEIRIVKLEKLSIIEEEQYRRTH